MHTETLKDKSNRVIGYIETHPDGKQVGKDAQFRTKGYFDPKTNKTTDERHIAVGSGNLLAVLITRS